MLWKPLSLPLRLRVVASHCCSLPRGPAPSFEVFTSHPHLCKVSLSSLLYIVRFERWVACRNPDDTHCSRYYSLLFTKTYLLLRHLKHFIPSSLAAWLALFTFLSFIRTHQIRSSKMPPLDWSIQRQSEERWIYSKPGRVAENWPSDQQEADSFLKPLQAALLSTDLNSRITPPPSPHTHSKHILKPDIWDVCIPWCPCQSTNSFIKYIIVGCLLWAQHSRHQASWNWT